MPCDRKNNYKYCFNVVHHRDSQRVEDFVKSMVDRFEQDNEINGFYPERDLLPGKNIIREHFRMIKESKYTILVIDMGFLSDPWPEYLGEATLKVLVDEGRKSEGCTRMIGLFGFTDTKMFVVRETNIPYLEYSQGKITKNFQRLIVISMDIAKESIEQRYPQLKINEVVYFRGNFNDELKWNKLLKVLRQEIQLSDVEEPVRDVMPMVTQEVGPNSSPPAQSVCQRPPTRPQQDHGGDSNNDEKEDELPSTQLGTSDSSIQLSPNAELSVRGYASGIFDLTDLDAAPESNTHARSENQRWLKPTGAFQVSEDDNHDTTDSAYISLPDIGEGAVGGAGAPIMQHNSVNSENMSGVNLKRTIHETPQELRLLSTGELVRPDALFEHLNHSSTPTDLQSVGRIPEQMPTRNTRTMVEVKQTSESTNNQPSNIKVTQNPVNNVNNNSSLFENNGTNQPSDPDQTTPMTLSLKPNRPSSNSSSLPVDEVDAAVSRQRSYQEAQREPCDRTTLQTNSYRGSQNAPVAQGSRLASHPPLQAEKEPQGAAHNSSVNPSKISRQPSYQEAQKTPPEFYNIPETEVDDFVIHNQHPESHGGARPKDTKKLPVERSQQKKTQCSSSTQNSKTCSTSSEKGNHHELPNPSVKEERVTEKEYTPHTNQATGLVSPSLSNESNLSRLGIELRLLHSSSELEEATTQATNNLDQDHNDVETCNSEEVTSITNTVTSYVYQSLQSFGDYFNG